MSETTTLWTRFIAAIEWVRGETRAAVAVVRAAPLAQTPHRLLDAVGATTGAPALATDGADVGGHATLNLGYVHSVAAQTSTVVLWLWDGEDWLEHSTIELDKTAGALDALDSEGYPRVAVQLTSAPASGTLTVKVFPHNEV